MLFDVQSPIAMTTLSLLVRFRFSLRSYFIFTMLVCVFFAWVAKERQQSESERQIGRRFQNQGCNINFLGVYDSMEVSGLNWQPHGISWRVADLVREEGTQGWWRDLARQILGERIFKIHSCCSFDQEDIALLARLKSLKVLNIGGTSLTDEQVKSLQQVLPNCEIKRSV